MFDSGMVIYNISVEACTNNSFTTAFELAIVESVYPQILHVNNITILSCNSSLVPPFVQKGVSNANRESISITFSISLSSWDETYLIEQVLSLQGLLRNSLRSFNFTRILNDLIVMVKYIPADGRISVSEDSFFSGDVEVTYTSLSPTVFPTVLSQPDKNSEEMFSFHVGSWLFIALLAFGGCCLCIFIVTIGFKLYGHVCFKSLSYAETNDSKDVKDVISADETEQDFNFFDVYDRSPENTTRLGSHSIHGGYQSFDGPTAANLILTHQYDPNEETELCV